jgi:hypothetical protein
MRTPRMFAPGAIGVLLAVSPLLAHHDWPVDRTNVLTITGTVTAYRFAEPHVMITLDVAANGTIETWNVGGSNTKYSAVNGWDRKTLKPGDVITAVGFRFRDGSHAAQLEKVVMAGGKEMYLYGPPALLRPLTVPGPAPSTSSGSERRP